MLIALVFDALLGLAFSLCARDRVRADGPFAFPAFPLVVAFAGIVVAPVALYLHAAHPAWSWMYLVDPSALPGLLVLPLVTLHAGVVPAGFYLGAHLLRTGRARALRYTVGIGAVVLLLATVLAWGRVGRYGEYGDFHAGRALALMEVKLGFVLVGVIVGLAAAAGFTAVELLRDSRRVRAR